MRFAQQFIVLLACTIGLLGTLYVASTYSQESQPAPPVVSDAVLDLIVMIEAQLADQESKSIGAGIIFGAGGDRLYIATANHVVRQGAQAGQQIRVRLRSLPGEPAEAKLLADIDRSIDLAVLSVPGIKALGIDLKTLGFDKVGEPTALRRGDTVSAIGQPNGARWRLSVTPDRFVRLVGDVLYFESTTVAPGHSGGALLNAEGQIVGMIQRDQPPEPEALSITRVLERVTNWGYPVSLGHQVPPDITGTWVSQKTAKTPLIYFDFKVVEDKLFGTVSIVREFLWFYGQNWEPGERGILNGRIIGKRVSFTTQDNYVKEFGDPHKGIPDLMGERTTTYRGEIQGDEIRFTRESAGGYATMTAKKIVDLSKVAFERSSSTAKHSYGLAYKLPGHEGGVRSLSFGPDEGRFRSGGLRLASGGMEDGTIKYWDVATTELRGTDNNVSRWLAETSASSPGTHKDSGTDDSRSNPGKVPIFIAYRLKLRDGIDVNAIIVGVSSDKHAVQLYDQSEDPSGSGGGSGRTKKTLGTVGPVSMSANANPFVIAIAENEGLGKSTINIFREQWDMVKTWDVQRTLHCEGLVSALALSGDGKLLASAEAMESKETTIKMWDTATGAMKWSIASQRPVSHLTVSANGSILASGDDDDPQIRIWDASNGSLKHMLSAEPDRGVSFLLFGNTGKLLASAGVPSATIKLWTASAGTLDQALANEGPVGALAFSSDDQLLASGDMHDGSIKVWGKPTNPKIKEMRER